MNKLTKAPKGRRNFQQRCYHVDNKTKKEQSQRNLVVSDAIFSIVTKVEMAKFSYKLIPRDLRETIESGLCVLQTYFRISL